MRITEQNHYDRVCAYVDLDAIIENMEQMHQHLAPGTGMVGVIKTDGYGHGSVAIADALERLDYVWGYATATEEEALQLRAAEIRKPILILGYTFPYSYEALAREELRPAVFTREMAKELSDAGVRTGKKIKVHIKVDTGMGRIGIRPEEDNIAFVKETAQLPGIEIEGIFTHFSKADEMDKTESFRQYARFTEFIDRIEEETGIKIPLRHCSNSASIIELPEVSMDMVRAGITLYGLWPSEEVRRDIVALRPALSLRSQVVYVKKVEAGCSISYGGTFTAERDLMVATIPVGYGDGYPRSLSGRGEVLIQGHRCRILGRVCMDQLMVDVSELEHPAIGDVVTLVGTDGEECITMEELGELSGRFNYELACDLGKRIPRVYLRNGVECGYKDYARDVKTFLIG